MKVPFLIHLAATIASGFSPSCYSVVNSSYAPIYFEMDFPSCSQSVHTIHWTGPSLHENKVVREVKRKSLIEALLCNDKSRAKELMSEGVSIDHSYRTQDGNSLLHLATLEHDNGKAKFLLQHGAPLNVQNNAGETPLHIAAKSKDLAALTLLLGQPSINITIQDNKKYSAFNYACANTRLLKPFLALVEMNTSVDNNHT